MHRKSCLYRWGVGISKSRDGYLFVRILKLYAERCTMNKITVIGSGSVGSTIAYTLTVMGLAHEIVMIDINGDKALGEAIDIRQGGLFCAPSKIYAGTYEDAKDSNIVIITSGVARNPDQTRLDLAQTNVNILRSISFTNCFVKLIIFLHPSW